MVLRMRLAVLLLCHVLFVAVHCVSVNQRTHAKTSMRRGSLKDFRELFTPPTILFISSPMERKVSYIVVGKDFKSVGGIVLPLLDAGLVEPYGIAWDGARSALYVCDGALRKIFRVQVKAFKCTGVHCKGIDYHLKVEGNKYVIAEGIISQWATVDTDGNLYFTDQESKSVNKLPIEVIDKIISDQLLPKAVALTTEAEAEGEEAVKEKLAGLEGDTTKTSLTTPQPPSLFRLYETKVCPNVGTPAGLAAEGAELYWTNQVGGFSSGAVAEGKTSPKVKTPADGDTKPTFPSFKITNETGSAYGIALTSSKIIFTDTSHHVWATSRGTGETVALSNGCLKPRGIVWDGDNTAYIADQEGNVVMSMPVGLLKEGAPLTPTVDIHSPFGLALVRSSDPMWDPFDDSINWSGAHSVPSLRSLGMLVATTALLLAPRLQ